MRLLFLRTRLAPVLFLACVLSACGGGSGGGGFFGGTPTTPTTPTPPDNTPKPEMRCAP
ncbi:MULTISPECIES: hypothetical protein [Variovorax]|jgi:hypothetical protein|uniref:hypothetical protein n=1 Tax=Variovorax TaxID=34072 RepID=UPI00089A0902|nr:MULTISPECIES: hypothetical protein [Variovorax]MDQ0080136.1 hypothetical protein [Variovorax boronicumulans]SDY27764.1 hypothetical protein SAMN05518854_101676 [Variovorax sp. YR266]SET28115.1 hypothetical protein SAMN05443580_102683 [Variovorax sp. OV084]